MKNILTIAWREYRVFFRSPIAYVFLGVFLLLTNLLFFADFFINNQASLRNLFGMLPVTFLLFAPALSMGKWAEERKLGTLEILFTLPVRDHEIIIGKFFSCLLLLATTLLATLPLTITVALLGALDMGPVLGGYLGTFFLGAAYLSLGLFMSSLTENQIVAFIGGVFACTFFLLLSAPAIFGSDANWFAALLQYLSFGPHFRSIARGVIDTRDVLYYLSVTGFFLACQAKVLQLKARR